MTKFDHLFQNLPLETKVRMARYAEKKGYVLLPIKEETDGQTLVPIEVIKSDQITRDHFPHLDDKSFEAIKKFYRTFEENTIPGSEDCYPPLGYTPSLSQKEADVAAFLNFMIAYDQKFGNDGEDKYPIQRIATETTKTHKSLGFWKRLFNN